MTRNLACFCGLAAGLALLGLLQASARRPVPTAHPHIRPAGRRAMANPPRSWDIVDEQGDESFPASDPPGNY